MINFETLFKKQKELDLEIARKHNITYKETRDRRTLALLVELGELANSTRCFKYWSNKPSEEKARVMDEYADGLHFLISLGIDAEINVYSYEQRDSELSLSNLFLKMYEEVVNFMNARNKENYIKCFETYLLIASKLNMDEEDIFNSYLLKLGENYHRQETNY